MNKLSFDSNAQNLHAALSAALFAYFKREKRPPVLLCVGSDRLTGDSLGPLVGEHLTRVHGLNAFVYGTLDYPVTAKNLAETSVFIRARHPKNKVLAVDASLGAPSDVGVIRLYRGSLSPGAGVNKILPRVGDFGLTAVVNGTEGDRRLLLAGTRLSLVYRLSLQLAAAIAGVYRLRADANVLIDRAETDYSMLL
jgi:putative sporulation protein YyaC